jgi:hypothetical protein
MKYIKLTDGVPKPFTLRQLDADNIGISFPAEPSPDVLAAGGDRAVGWYSHLAKWGLHPYEKTAQPDHDSATQAVEKGYAKKADGAYVETYIVRDKTSDELAVDLSEARDVAFMEKGDFIEGLVVLGILDGDEAVLVSKGEWLARLNSFLSYLSPSQARSIQIEWATKARIHRKNVFVMTLGSWLDGVTPEILDTLFGIGESSQ